MSRILDADPIRRTSVLWHDGHHGDVAVESQQDVEPILRSANENRKTRRGFKKEGFHHVGYIPAVLVEQLQREGIWDQGNKAILRWLDDHPEYKTHPAKLSR